MIHDSRKRLGQHFLVSPDVLKKIISAAALSPSDMVLEIGPGRGALTRSLAASGAQVVAIEKDRRLTDLLKDECKERGLKNVRIVAGDILKIDLAELGLGDDYRVIANIPYYLTARLIRRLLETEPSPRDLLLMVQREVAERITAKPPRMNLLALSVQTYAEAKILFPVPQSAFHPAPEVESAFIAITAISDRFFHANRIEPKTFFRIIRASFSGKRKVLENSLSKNLKLSKEMVIPALRRESVIGRRPAELTLADWISVTRVLAPIMD